MCWLCGGGGHAGVECFAVSCVGMVVCGGVWWCVVATVSVCSMLFGGGCSGSVVVVDMAVKRLMWNVFLCDVVARWWVVVAPVLACGMLFGGMWWLLDGFGVVVSIVVKSLVW